MSRMFGMIGVVRFPVEGHIDILEFMSDYERDRLRPKWRGVDLWELALSYILDLGKSGWYDGDGSSWEQIILHESGWRIWNVQAIKLQEGLPLRQWQELGLRLSWRSIARPSYPGDRGPPSPQTGFGRGRRPICSHRRNGSRIRRCEL